jgi:ABC-type transport system involved in multi-copper enzyme maturation permease subunit
MNGPGLRALLYLTVLSMRRQLRSKKTVVAIVFLALLAALVLFRGLLRPWNHDPFGRNIVFGIFVTVIVPMVCLAFGTGALGDDRDEKSLVHLFARPLPRSGIALAKLLAVAPIALCFTVGGLFLLVGVGNLVSGESLTYFISAFWPSVLLSTLAYLSLFHLFAVLFRHSTAIAVVYAFFIEVIIGVLPGILKRISIQFYAKSLALGRAAPDDIGIDPLLHKLYGPIPGSTALPILLVLIAALAAAAALAFALKEYPEN